MDEKIIDILKSIGFTSNEATIYLDLLANNNSLAREIAKRTEIHKSNVYDTLKKLISRGFIKEVLKENSKYFIAETPEILLDYLDQKQRSIKEIIPDLSKGIKREIDEEAEVSLSKGVISARTEIENFLDINEEILVYGVPKKALDILGIWFLDDLHKERIKRKIPLRQIFDENIQERVKKLNKLPYTKIRYSGIKESSPIFIGICKDTVVTLILTNPITIIKIKNKDVAFSYKDHFELLWQNAGEDN